MPCLSQLETHLTAIAIQIKKKEKPCIYKKHGSGPIHKKYNENESMKTNVIKEHKQSGQH
jgi:hypothetical protein